MTRLLFLFGWVFLPGAVVAWLPSSRGYSPIHTVVELSMVKRGRGSIGKEIAGGGDDITTNEASSSGVNWTPIPVSAQALPTEENRVSLLETNLVTLKNGQTNPTGAVSVLRYQKQIYCFSVNCPSCQVPLTKAQCLPANEESNGKPRLVCDLCKSTYNVQTGEKLTSQKENVGLFGTVVRSIFSASASGPLTTYRLGERNGKLLISGLK
jgi:nitrite reductase/ring-hydroxylating ferredoxin subunit